MMSDIGETPDIEILGGESALCTKADIDLIATRASTSQRNKARLFKARLNRGRAMPMADQDA
jgi:hypothetical protein